MIVPPVIIDDGHAGTWLEALLFSPHLNVVEYAGGDHPDRLGPAPALPFHGDGDSRG